MNIIKDNGLIWKYVGITLSTKSSITILSGSLKSNVTYQFMVKMINRQKSTLQINGYLLVQSQEISSPSYFSILYRL